MRCAFCSEHAIIDQPARCKEHFITGFEQKVKETIDEYRLIPRNARIAVAVSGGKDSLTVLRLMHKWYGDSVTAVAIDEGIEEYREHTLADARKFCVEHHILLLVKSFKELTGFTLDELLKREKLHPCTVCGTLRRHLINVAAKDFDVLVTGHNADDEAQAVVMNIVKGNTELFARLGPRSGSGALGFTRRVKPLYFCTEKEVMTYAFLHHLTTTFTECPHTNESYRQLVRDGVNSYAQSHPGVKERVLRRFLSAKPSSEEPVALRRCNSCGEPSSGSPCSACTYLLRISDNSKSIASKRK